MRDRSPDTRAAGDQDHCDFGLATYLIVRLFDWLKADRGAPPVVFPTEPPIRETLLERLDEAERLVDVTYVVGTDRNRHLARLLIPLGLVRNSELFHDSDPGRRAITSELIEGPTADLPLDFPLFLGRTRLDRDTVAELAARDVVLFDEHGYAPDADAPEAEPAARLHLADGGARYLPGVTMPGPTHWQFHPLDLHPRSRDKETDPVDETADRPDDASPADRADPGATDLLETPEVQLEVRVGSTHLTVRQLGQLQAGEVLTLDTRVGQPVDLVVDDQVVGEGELVEVEGRLGVRVRRMKN
ncbi:MAG: type III secretion system cytoplasmic ring protein SctQ [Bradymonadaceae bacterium]